MEHDVFSSTEIMVAMTSDELLGATVADATNAITIFDCDDRREKVMWMVGWCRRSCHGCTNLFFLLLLFVGQGIDFDEGCRNKS